MTILKDFIKTDLATDKIGAFLTDIGLEVEGIEKVKVNGIDDTVFDLKVLIYLKVILN